MMRRVAVAVSLILLGAVLIDLIEWKMNSDSSENSLNLLGTNTDEKEGQRKPSVLSYFKYSTTFVNEIVDCYHDDKCRIFYHHVEKTGGTFLCDSFTPFFNHGEIYNSRTWCCNERFMSRFRKDPLRYCQAGKFLPFEVYGTEMGEVIHTCLSRGLENLTRIVALATYRQPIQRLVSQIHHRCNMGYCKNSSCDRACDDCRFAEDGEHGRFWMDWIDHNNRVYREQLRLLSDGHHDDRVRMLIVEDVELNDMAEQLQVAMGRNLTRKGRGNSLHHGRCEFRAPMSMLKLLRPSDEAYKGILRL